MGEKRIIVVGGPTASGKTVRAIELAQQYGTHILSADSRQFYREMRIGNARPTEEELAAAPHHFIADRNLDQPLSAGQYAREALVLLDELFQDHDTVIVAGGSGLFIRALCEGLDEFPPVTDAAREQVSNLAQRGLPALQAALQQRDPTYYAEADLANERRLRRALEVTLSGDHPYSYYRNRPRPPRPFRTEYVLLNPPRPELYDRINRRVDRMLSDGLEAEARSLYPHHTLPVLQTVGYQEWWPHFEGTYDRERAVELIKRNTRRYAKRQITWLRGQVI